MNRPNQISTIQPLITSIMDQVEESYQRIGKRVFAEQGVAADDLEGVFAGLMTVVVIAFHERYGILPPLKTTIEGIMGMYSQTSNWDENGIDTKGQVHPDVPYGMEGDM